MWPLHTLYMCRTRDERGWSTLNREGKVCITVTIILRGIKISDLAVYHCDCHEKLSSKEYQNLASSLTASLMEDRKAEGRCLIKDSHILSYEV